MSFYEFTGKSIKEAIARACEELNTDEALLEIEVLEESTRGFLGLVGQRDAKVRVKRRDILKEVLETEPPAVADSYEDEPQAQEENGSEDYEENVILPKPVSETVIEEPSPRMEEAQKVLDDILQRIPVEALVEASMRNGAIYLDIKGDGSGLLIGKKGQTLDALQFLVNKIINKENSPEEKVEIIVDTENYRIRKHENLREIALRMSQKAKKTLKPVSFNPMPPNERRIIHLILAEDREVFTKSYGEGPLRRIIVYPRRGVSNRRRRR
jgi:spoIIIJ-associated protein